MFLREFIQKRPYYFWHVKNPENLSPEAAVEGILNYGDFDDVKKIISILGIKTVAGIFRKQSKGKRGNYSPKIKNYFELYFRRYA